MNKFLNVYYKVDDAFNIVIKYLCAALLAVMIIVCFGNTFCRYFLGFSFKWAEEIVRYAAVWVTCVGASLTARSRNGENRRNRQSSSWSPWYRASRRKPRRR
jgi:TRAP-type C4-dicarboxylate transport system permease small subunit